MSELASRYQRVKDSIHAHVPLVAVSKFQSTDAIQALYDLGHRDFGENRVQELKEKAQVLPKDIRWHMIGSIQTNKIKDFAPFVHLVHAVDRDKVAKELQKAAVKHDRQIEVLLQMHIAEEASKHGYDADGLNRFDPVAYPNLHVKGLMGMATFTEDMSQVRSEFQVLKAQFDQLRSLHRKSYDTLSMGMSGDFELAIEEGSTMVRVGSAIFGPRTY